MGFPFPFMHAVGVAGKETGNGLRRGEPIAGVGLDDAAITDEIGEGIAERLRAHAARGTEVVDGGGAAEIGECGLDAAGW